VEHPEELVAVGPILLPDGPDAVVAELAQDQAAEASLDRVVRPAEAPGGSQDLSRPRSWSATTAP